MSNKTEFLTVAQFARKIGFRLDYIYALIWAGRIKAQKINGFWRIPPEELVKRQKIRAAYEEHK